PLLSRFPALGFLTGVRQKTEGRRELVVLLTPHIWTPEQAMAHAPPPHRMPGAFGASGPVANTSTTFDLDTGRMTAGAALAAGPGAVIAPGGVAASPAGSGSTATPPMPGAPGAAEAGQPAVLASAASGSTGDPTTSSAANASQSDPATPQRRRRLSLRQWITGWSRDKQANSSSNPAGPVQPSIDRPGPRGEPQSAV